MFDCCEFVGVAEDLLTGNGGASQAYLRTAAGRAYYAVYGLIRKNLIVRHSHQFGDAGKHRQIVRGCEADSRHPRLTVVGQWLKQLMQSRVKADYQWQATSDLAMIEVEDAISAAGEAIKAINALTAGDWAALHRQM